mmetsp:Transcript_34450/g.99242  ORF Transcript_34450/g.99242 Transcript_34450/m.99242 type:complete len:719 (-) Transcript_34450:93-2249(-)
MPTAEKNSSYAWPSDVDVDLGGLPDTVERRCTDIPWLIFFVACCGLWAAALWQSVQHGSFSRLGAFEDGNGRRCNEDLWQHKQRYLFFCRNNSAATLDMARPICVPFCPNSTQTMAEACGGVPDYPTVDLFGMVCFPDVTQVFISTDQARDLSAFESAARTTVAARIIVERYRSLASCMGISVFASYIEIYILEYNASCIVKFGMVTLSSGCMITAAYLLGCFSSLGLTPVESPYLLPGGITLLVIGSVFGCILVNLRDSVEAACDCIELACTCVMRTPMLTILPLGVTVINLALGTISWGGVFLMLSCGRLELVHGALSVRFGMLNTLAFLLQVFMGWWMHQVVFASSAFIIAYATALWYFHSEASPRRRLPKCAVWQAIWYAHRYHFGTIVVGGAVIFVTRLLRLPLSLLVSWTKMHNPLGKIFSFCCCGANHIYNKIHPLSKNAYIDVALNARPFWTAARCADAVMMHEADTIRILNGATWVFQFVGVTANAALGACLMIWYSNYVVGDDSDVTLVMAVAGAAIAGATAFPFALIFDTVSDTIFYCSEVDQLRHPPPPKPSRPGARGVVARYCPCLYKPNVTPERAQLSQRRSRLAVENFAMVEENGDLDPDGPDDDDLVDEAPYSSGVPSSPRQTTRLLEARSPTIAGGFNGVANSPDDRWGGSGGSGYGNQLFQNGFGNTDSRYVDRSRGDPRRWTTAGEYPSGDKGSGKGMR